MLEAQVAGVHALGCNGDKGLRGEPLLFAEGTARGFLSGFIRVEGENHLASTRRVCVVKIAEHAADDLDVLATERGTAGGNRRGHAREVAGHDVGVTLDDHDLSTAGDVALRQVEAVQHLALVVDRRLRGVEVLGPGVIVAKPARPEPEGLARDIPNRPHQPPAEAVVRAPIALAEKASGDELRLGVAEAAEVLAEGVERLWRVADTETRGGGVIEAARAEERARQFGVGGGELRNEVPLGGFVRREDSGSIAVIGRRAAAVFIVQLIAEASGHALDGLGESHVVHLLQESVDVAALAASEAVVETDLRTHVEARAPLVVERAQPLHRSDARVLQCHVITDDVGEVRARPHLVDVITSDKASHTSILRSWPGPGAGPPQRQGRRTAAHPRPSPRPPSPFSAPLPPLLSLSSSSLPLPLPLFLSPSPSPLPFPFSFPPPALHPPAPLFPPVRLLLVLPPFSSLLLPAIQDYRRNYVEAPTSTRRIAREMGHPIWAPFQNS